MCFRVVKLPRDEGMVPPIGVPRSLADSRSEVISGPAQPTPVQPHTAVSGAPDVHDQPVTPMAPIPVEVTTSHSTEAIATLRVGWDVCCGAVGDAGEELGMGRGGSVPSVGAVVKGVEWALVGAQLGMRDSGLEES